MESTFIQSVEYGKHSFCPMVTGIMDAAAPSAHAASDALYTHQHLYGRPPPPLGEIVNLVDGEDDTSKKDSVKGGSSHATSAKDNKADAPAVAEAPHLFSLETLIITVSAGAVAALVVGFVTGYCCGRRCHKDDMVIPPHMPAFQETDYEYFEHQRGGMMRPPPGPMGADFPGGPHPPMLTRPLLPTESSKLDNRQEEVIT